MSLVTPLSTILKQCALWGAVLFTLPCFSASVWAANCPDVITNASAAQLMGDIDEDNKAYNADEERQGEQEQEGDSDETKNNLAELIKNQDPATEREPPDPEKLKNKIEADKQKRKALLDKVDPKLNNIPAKQDQDKGPTSGCPTNGTQAYPYDS